MIKLIRLVTLAETSTRTGFQFFLVTGWEVKVTGWEVKVTVWEVILIKKR